MILRWLLLQAGLVSCSANPIEVISYDKNVQKQRGINARPKPPVMQTLNQYLFWHFREEIVLTVLA